MSISSIKSSFIVISVIILLLSIPSLCPAQSETNNETFKSYYSNGNVHLEWEGEEDWYNGLLTEYDTNGSVIRKAYYRDNELISEIDMEGSYYQQVKKDYEEEQQAKISAEQDGSTESPKKEREGPTSQEQTSQKPTLTGPESKTVTNQRLSTSSEKHKEGQRRESFSKLRPLKEKKENPYKIERYNKKHTKKFEQEPYQNKKSSRASLETIGKKKKHLKLDIGIDEEDLYRAKYKRKKYNREEHNKYN